MYIASDINYFPAPKVIARQKILIWVDWFLLICEWIYSIASHRQQTHVHIATRKTKQIQITLMQNDWCKMI